MTNQPAVSEQAQSLLTTSWLGLLRRYLPFIALTNLVWETLHLPLYTLWKQGSLEEKAFAVVALYWRGPAHRDRYSGVGTPVGWQ